MRTKNHVIYGGFDLVSVEAKYPTFVKELEGLLPKNAHLQTNVVNGFAYGKIVHGKNTMLILQDDVLAVNYTDGTSWGKLVVKVLDFMDDVSFVVYDEPCRMPESKHD